jgi:hypothetical protein
MKEVYLSIMIEQIKSAFSEFERNWLEIFNVIEYNLGIPKTNLSANLIGQGKCLR